MDGLNIIIEPGIVDRYFTRDQYGLLTPSAQHLQPEIAAKQVDRQNRSDTGYYRRISEINYRTDVEIPNNPHGNTPVVGTGYHLFGPRPFDGKGFGERITAGPSSEVTRKLERRANKILNWQLKAEQLYSSIKPGPDAPLAIQALYAQEGFQVMSGGGFDGNHVGEVTKSVMNFVARSMKPYDIAGSNEAKIWVASCVRMREYLKNVVGLPFGSIQPMGITQVRLAQESDGMIGWPVLAKSLAPLTKDIATRLLLAYGVDTRPFVKNTVIDVRDGSRVPYRVVDALAYVADHLHLVASEHPTIVVPLERIQKHGWKKEKGQTVAKDGKTRSIYPPSVFPGMIEAMIFAPFNDKLKELKASFIPSLQDKPTRVKIIWDVISRGLEEGYEYLPADWSKYDATVKGALWATMIDIVVKPFFHAKYQHWVEYVTYATTYKFLMVDKRLCEINNDLLSEVLTVSPHAEVGHILLLGTIGGLLSGLKFTHVGGSMYGEVAIHYGIPMILGYEPRLGFQGGDDTLVAYPRNRVDYKSAENTYKPFSEAAAKWDLDLNAGKQDWWVVGGELGKVFLQDTFHVAGDVRGIGSIFRPYDAVFYSERNKNLTPPEQLMAEIARMNQGADSPFAPVVVREWLKDEQAVGVLFKAQGVNAFNTIVESIGLSTDEIAKKVGVGSFSYGVSKEDLEKGTLAILPIIADVAAEMDFQLSPDKVAKWLGGSVSSNQSKVDVLADPDEYDDLD